MPLSRLENFIKNVEGNILYVNPNDQDATDHIGNQGNSLTRPFKTIQRALIEAARFSYQSGTDNDSFDKTTIVLYPGIHKLDNRAGFSAHDNSGTAEYKNRFGQTVSLPELSSSSNFDIEDETNVLYHFNSVTGGVIIPRGTSLVGMDLRKTKVFPMFVPDPTNSEIDKTAIFKITGGCYFWQFSLFDGDPNGTVYKNYTNTKFAPNFSHHKLTCFEYADGNNTIELPAITGGTTVTNTSLTDLDTYYVKIANAYGNSSLRSIPDWPANNDLEVKLPENQIVGAIQADPIGITSVFSTNRSDYVYNGVVGRNIVVTSSKNHNLNVGTPIIVTGITTTSSATTDDPTFNAKGGALVSKIISPTKFAFVAPEVTSVSNPHLSGDEQVQVEPDTVSGASPYIFNLSLRSVYGMNGLHADGSKATGFKSMVLAQFTGIGLQKDDDAFLLYDETTGLYQDNTTVADSEKPLHINSRAIFKPSYENVHVKVSNSAILQCVSIFAIGYSKHFLAESGGDQSITNSNSNFGAKALIARGYRDTAFGRDDTAYITHIIPPKHEVKFREKVFWNPLDITITNNYTVGSGTSDRLFVFGYSDEDSPPSFIVDSFRIGSQRGEIINLEVANENQTALVRMHGSNTASNEKIAKVQKTANRTAQDITESNGSIFKLEDNHEFSDGEKVKILSDDGILPDGLDHDQIYFVITSSASNELGADQIKLAKTLNESISSNLNPISGVNTRGGILSIVSRVADKAPGEVGHPIQYDNTNNNWYVGVRGDSSNLIYASIKNSTKRVTSKSFFKRKPDTRSLDDRIYKLRYVIPKEFTNAKPPSAGYVIQESSTSIFSNNSEFTSNISDNTDLRNVKIIHNVEYNAGTGIATVTSELPHRLRSGSQVKLKKIKSSNNTNATDKLGFNGIFDINSIIDSKTFDISIPTTRNPGVFLSNRPSSINSRDENQPNFSICSYEETYYIYRVEEVSEYLENLQDGIYHLTCIKGSVNPTSSYFSNRGFSQNVVNLYPQLDRDNYSSDPKASISVALNQSISKVVTSDLRDSITKEAINELLIDNRNSFSITDAIYDTNTGVATFTADVEHNFNTVTSITIADAGKGYGFSGISTTVYNAKLTGGTGEGATVTFEVPSGGNHVVTNPVIVDGGSGYTVGDTLTVSTVGIPTFSTGSIPYEEASFTVAKVNRNSNDSIQVENVIDFGTSGLDFNGVYRILSVPSSKKVSVLLGADKTGIGTYSKNGIFNIAGSGTTITEFIYSDSKTGIATVVTDSPHGLNLGNSFKIDWNEESNTISSAYGGIFKVGERLGITSFSFFIGEDVATNAVPSTVGYVLPTGYTSQNADSDISLENITKRMNPFRVGFTTTLGSALSQSESTITLSNSDGFYKGDYLQIDSEIVRVKNNFSGNSASIIRGVFGTDVGSSENGSLVSKIRPIPIEARRYSILRASGHTFEYLGFGPGNYSTSLPQRQDRVLSQDEQLLSQSEKSDGGVVVYTGMNDSGDFYVGNRRLSSATGQEETIGIPIPTFVGDDSDNPRLSVIFDDVTVKDSIKVEGGAGQIIQSEFNGPLVINNKLTVTSDQGADFKELTLKGLSIENTRRKQTVAIGTPADDGDNSVGDIVWKNDPVPGGYLGWVFAGEEGSDNNFWRKFGFIATERANDGHFPDSNQESPLGNFTILPSKIGINTNIPASVIDVQAGLTQLDTLLVAGVSTFQSGVTIGSVDIDDLTVHENATISGIVKIASNTGIAITATAGMTVCGNTEIHGIVSFRNGTLDISGDTSVGSALTVTGNTSLGGTLDVSGNTSLGGILIVSGDTSVGSALTVTGNTDFNGTLTVSGDTSVGGALTVTGNLDVDGFLTVRKDIDGNELDLSGRLSVSGNTSVGGGLTVTENTDFNGTLTVSGDTSVGSALTVTKNTDLNGTLTVSGDTSVGSALTVTENTDLNGTLNVSGDTTLSSNLSVIGDTSVGSALTVTKNTDLNGILTVSGDTSVGSALTVTGNTDLNGTLSVCSATTLSSTLDVSGNTSLGGILIVSGDTSVGSALTVTGNTDLNGILTVSGDTSVGSALTVTGNTDLNDTLSVFGNTSIGGDLVLTGAITALTVSTDADLNGKLTVAGDTSVGSALTVTKNTDLNGTLSVSGNTTLSSTLTVEDNTDLNGSLEVSGNTSVGGITTVTGNTDLNGTLSVCGSTTLSSTLTVEDNTDLNGTLSVCGDTSVGSALTVTGNTDLNGTLSVCGSTTLSSTLAVKNNTDLNGTLSVSGNTSIGGITTITGRIVGAGGIETPTDIDVGFGGDLDITGNLSINGSAVFGSSLEVCTTLDVQSSVSFGDTLKVTNNTDLNGALDVCGNTDLNGTLSVCGATTLSSSLSVSGNTDLNGTLSVCGNTSLDGSLDVCGNTSLNGALTVNGTTSFLMLKDYSEKRVDLGSNLSGSVTINLSQGNFFRADQNDNTTYSFNTTGSRAADTTGTFSFSIFVRNNGNAVTWPNNIYYPRDSIPTATVTNGRGDLWTFITKNGGSNWYGVISIYDLAGI